MAEPSDLGVVLDTGDLYANFPVEIRQTKDRGRIVVAKRDLKAGEIVLRSMAYMVTVGDEYKTTVCSTCFVHAPARLPFFCPGCRELYFCSERCRDHADHFSIECQALKRLHMRENRFTDDENSEIRMIVRVVAKAVEERRNNNQPQHHKMLSILDPQDYQGIPQPLYSDYCTLVPNSHKFQPETTLSVKKMARFVKKIFPKPYIDEFTEEEIYGMFFREKCNCFGIWDQKDRCLASAIFPSASFFNHSCVPNCTRFPDHAGLIAIRALYPIPAGTELNISYITLHDSPRETRMEQLRYYYCFECGCPRCSDPTGETDKFIERFLCKRDGCTGLLVPLETDKPNTRSRCRVCPYEEPCNYADFCGEFKAPHQAPVVIPPVTSE